MNSILTKLVSNDKEIKGQLKEQTTVLNRMYALQQKEYKEAHEARRKEEQKEKRKSADEKRNNPLEFLKKDAKKKKGGILQTILQGLANVLGGSLKSLLKPLGDLGLKAFGGAIKALTPLLTKLATALGPVFAKLAAIAGIAIATAKTTDSAVNKLYKQAGGQGRTRSGRAFTLRDIENLKNEQLKFFQDNNMLYDSRGQRTEAAARRISKFDTVMEEMRQRKTANDELYWIREQIKHAETQRDRHDPGSRFRARIQERIDLLKSDEAAKLEMITQRSKRVTDSFNALQLTESQLLELQIKSGRRDPNTLTEKEKKSLEGRPIYGHLYQDWSHTEYADQMQRGGFVGTVPHQGSDGDRFKTMVEAGSVVMNQTASRMFQRGGTVPVMLEQGEKVFSPRDPAAGAALAMNTLIPRFQKGGQVIPQSQASGARDGVTASMVAAGTNAEDLATEAAAAEATNGKTGADAIIQAAEASAGIYQGVGEMCAKTTREVLRLAGHPAADKKTSTANLDSPQGFGPSKVNGLLAGSFAGSDMGTVYEDPSKAPPGSVIMWRGTYGQWKGTDAVTHVGLKGKGDDIYHHGTSPGWGKDSFTNYTPDFAVDLNGTASGSGLGSSSSSSASSGVSKFQAFMSSLGDFGSLGSAFGELFSTAQSLFSGNLDGGAGIFKSFFGDGAFDASPAAAAAGTATTTAGAASASVSNPTAKAVLDSIAIAEGTADKGYGTMFGGKVNQALANGKLTVAQAIALGDSNAKSAGSGATGRYQFMPQTLEDLVRTGHLSMDTQFTPEAQDKAALDLISRRGINLNDGLSKSEMQGIAQEWASVAGAGYTYQGRSQAKYSQGDFLQMVKDKGGTVQMQTGGVANMSGSSVYGSNMVTKSQEHFADMLASKMTPVVVNAGGGAPPTSVVAPPGTQTAPPNLSSDDASVVAMEYKYRITMGSAV